MQTVERVIKRRDILVAMKELSKPTSLHPSHLLFADQHLHHRDSTTQRGATPILVIENHDPFLRTSLETGLIGHVDGERTRFEAAGSHGNAVADIGRQVIQEMDDPDLRLKLRARSRHCHRAVQAITLLWSSDRLVLTCDTYDDPDPVGGVAFETTERDFDRRKRPTASNKNRGCDMHDCIHIMHPTAADQHDCALSRGSQ